MSAQHQASAGTATTVPSSRKDAPRVVVRAWTIDLRRNRTLAQESVFSGWPDAVDFLDSSLWEPGWVYEIEEVGAAGGAEE